MSGYPSWVTKMATILSFPVRSPPSNSEAPPMKKVRSIPHSLNSGWPRDLPWLREGGKGNTGIIPSWDLTSTLGLPCKQAQARRLYAETHMALSLSSQSTASQPTEVEPPDVLAVISEEPSS